MCSVEYFTEIEQRTAYFNGDEIQAFKKRLNILDRIQVSHMAQMQNILDFPPARKLTPLGRLDPEKATESKRRGETLFVGKAQCAVCHPAPSYLDNQMQDNFWLVGQWQGGFFVGVAPPRAGAANVVVPKPAWKQ